MALCYHQTNMKFNIGVDKKKIIKSKTTFSGLEIQIEQITNKIKKKMGYEMHLVTGSCVNECLEFELTNQR